MLDTICSLGPHSYVLLSGAPREFLGPDNLAKRDIFGSMKDAESFWVRKNARFFGSPPPSLKYLSGIPWY